MSDYETLLYSVADGIATITLNRPERRNGATLGMMQDLLDVFDRTDSDDAVKAVIVTGAGNKAFCVGADLGADSTATFDYSSRSDQRKRLVVNGIYRDTGGLVTLRIFDSLKPVIGAVNGVAVGFGATVLLPMDIRIASTTARFGYPFVRRGIVPEAASAWFLPRIVGIATALEWCFSGRVFAASEALERRLIRSVHEPTELMNVASAIAREIVDHASPVSVALTRHMMWRMLGAAHPMEAHKIDSRAVQETGKSADGREGISAFLEKRAPVFAGRVSGDLPRFFPWWTNPEFE
jgi:enoyl-CoA hydratase/carnithine racemase